MGDQDVNDANLRKAVAVQQVLADLQGTPCGGETTAGESQDSACNRIALSGELLWLAVGEYADANDLTATDTEVDAAISGLETQVGADAARQDTRGARCDARRPLRARPEDPDDPCGSDRDRREAGRSRRTSAQYEQRASSSPPCRRTTSSSRPKPRRRTSTNACTTRRSSSSSRSLAPEVSIEPGAKDSGGELPELSRGAVRYPSSPARSSHSSRARSRSPSTRSSDGT